jgi:NTE family protein
MRADAVFSGGGVKGIAFAGALRAAEEAGYDEWVRVAGTSAGAIVAMALAVGYGAEGIHDALGAQDLSRLADYGGPITRVVDLVCREGLTRGKALTAWLERLLGEAPRPARTFGDLEAGRLQVVGTDLAHSRLVVFPDDVGLYEDEHGRALAPERFPIATAVRVSAGYPYFFPPVRLRDRATGKDGVLVDGGVASAFPLFVFDRPAPRHPTWGFRLHSGFGARRPVQHDIDGLDWPLDMLKAILDTAMNAFDTRDLRAFGDRTVSIPTGDVPTLAFSLTAEQRRLLYDRGRAAGRAFFAGRPTGRNGYGALPAGTAA